MARIIKETVRGIDIVDLEDELLQDREIFLTGGVDANSTNELIKQLMYLEREDDEAEITLYINSPGGEVTSGLAVYDYMTLMKAPIRTVSIGTAASMGALLFLAGDKRQMLPHTRIMIHDPSYANADMSGKKPHEIQHELDKLNETRQIIAQIIAEKTGKTLQEVYEVTANDTYYNAEEAVRFGLATEIIDSKSFGKGGKRV
ncbi:MAG: ATP-dependent Clp protease proteolytic subunit [Lachnospiraceae bacterium]|nr:ATP-dependent Clp protease proteolytic subunit [Lachnospiraceae bacterium]